MLIEYGNLSLIAIATIMMFEGKPQVMVIHSNAKLSALWTMYSNTYSVGNKDMYLSFCALTGNLPNKLETYWKYLDTFYPTYTGH